MSSAAVVHITPLRDAHGSRTQTRRRAFSAAAALLDESRADVTLPDLADRANLAPSTLHAHFPSVDALFAELYLYRISALPLVIDPAATIQSRVSEQLRAITLIVADEPRLAAACNRALLRADDPVVAGIRARIGAEVHRRIAAALGAGAWPEVHATLEAVFWGALVQVHSDAFGHRQMADRLDTMLALILPAD